MAMTVMNPEQLAEWYEAYGAELLLFARQLTDAQQAEDIVQEAFIKLLGEGDRRTTRGLGSIVWSVMRPSALCDVSA